MKLEKIQLVQESFAQVEPIADAAVDLFYARLFTLDPSLRAMFPAELAEQKKLRAMLKLAVNSLNRWDELVPAVQTLGQRHDTYAATFEMVETVGAAQYSVPPNTGRPAATSICRR